MKKQIFIFALFVFAFSLCAQTNGVMPDMPVTEPVGGWTDDSVFWAGVSFGMTWGGIAFWFRVLRQFGRQNPEI
jgi:hypothetical protein